jgi:cytochrome b
MRSENIIKVWDLPVRFFHWSLVAGFTISYCSAKYHFGDIHVLVGYGLCVLLLARLGLGFFGSQYARFKSFVFSPAETLEYIRTMVRGNPRHYMGHNPAGALMVFALLFLLALVFSTGLLTLSVIDFEGPLLSFANKVDDETSYAINHLHELLTNIGIALVAMHLIGVLVGSIQHKENLVRAMVTGNKILPSHEAADSDSRHNN